MEPNSTDAPRLLHPDDYWPTEPERTGRAKWPWVLGVLLVVGVLVAVAGYYVELRYYTISPGAALDTNDTVAIDGTASYEPDGELLLLFVRQRARVNIYEYLRATLDPDVDLLRERDVTGGESPDDVRVASRADMELAQITAKRLALERAGYVVPRAGEGVVVLGALPSKPAGALLEADDVILAADGDAIREFDDLTGAIAAHEPGESVVFDVVRADEQLKVEVPVSVELDANGTERRVVGVIVSPVYDFPVDIAIDTGRIGGPSAGLAMTLSILDELTPGELTGGESIAVTGTIAPDGSVGVIGGAGQKAVTARSVGATLFLVPIDNLEEARGRAGDLPVVGVRDLGDALEALEAAGGDPIELTARVAA